MAGSRTLTLDALRVGEKFVSDDHPAREKTAVGHATGLVS